MNTEKKSIRKQILIKPSQDEKLQGLKLATGKSMNELIGEAIDNYIKTKMRNEDIKKVIDLQKNL